MSTPAVIDTPEEWAAEAMEAIRVLASTGEPFSADDLRELLRPAPTGSVVGQVFKEAHRLRFIRKYAPMCSAAESCRGRLIWQWKGVTS